MEWFVMILPSRNTFTSNGKPGLRPLQKRIFAARRIERVKAVAFFRKGTNVATRYGTGQALAIGCMWKDCGFGIAGIPRLMLRFILCDSSRHAGSFPKK